VNYAFQNRAYVVCVAFVAVLSALSWRVITIQVVDRQQYASTGQRAFQRTETIPAIRGMIVDRRDETIAKTIPVASLFIDKNHLNNPNLAALALAYQEAITAEDWYELDDNNRRRRVRALRGEILASHDPEAITTKHLAYAIGVLARPLGMKREELRNRIETSRGVWVPIAKDLPEDIAERIREAVDAHWLQGFEFENSIKRWYTSPNQATHLVGFTGEVETQTEDGKTRYEQKGRFGIEAAMEEFLAGRDGWRKHQRDIRGLLIPGDAESLMPPRPGLNVRLTIDMGIQAIVEEELDAALAEFKSVRGSVILLEAKTGDVLAMASRPHFDLNRRTNIAENGFNYAIQGIYEPGSTFKIIAAAGALDAGLVTPRTSIFCNNGVLLEGGIRIPDHHPYGYLTVEGIMQKSSNIGSYKLARQLGPRRFFDYTHSFGFGKRLGIQLGGESRGVARNTGNPTDFSRVSYGYAISVTPLQMAAAYNVIACEGRLMKPRIVDSLIANDGTIVEEFPPETLEQTLKPATAKTLLSMLESVTVEGGTATRAAVPGFRVAGKTGTARKHNPNGRGYLSDSYIVSFAGIMPAQDPAFTCVVVIDDPRTTEVRRYGGTIAAPIFAKIAARVATRMNLQPTEPVPEDKLATAAANP
jgi:cell division protein FtsI/penicillin-binding protein 2